MEKTGRRWLRLVLIHSAKTISLLLAVSLLTFGLVNAAPGDPVDQYILGLGTAVSPQQREEIEAYWGVGETPVRRYVTWLTEVLRGNLGESSMYRRPVAEIIGERFAGSLALMAVAWVLSGLMGFGLGCLMGMCRGKWPDRVCRQLCYVLSTIPVFWLGLLFVLFFSVYLQWFPIGFSAPIGVLNQDITPGQRLHHLILPALTLSITSFPGIALHTRQKLLEVLSSDYVLFAAARGEGRSSILLRHGLRNTLLPALTLQFASFAELFGGSVLAENVFSYPGLGSAVAAAGLNKDVPLLLGITLFSALFVCVGNGIANLLGSVIDPRIREVKP